MEIGIQAEKCNCIEVCRHGVEPLNDCVCRLPGETVTAKCEVCKGTTWHNNGSCVVCVRKVRKENKQRAAARHAEILAAPPHPVDLSHVDDAKTYMEFNPVHHVQAPQKNDFAIVLRIKGVDIVLTEDADLVAAAIRASVRQ